MRDIEILKKISGLNLEEKKYLFANFEKIEDILSNEESDVLTEEPEIEQPEEEPVKPALTYDEKHYGQLLNLNIGSSTKSIASDFITAVNSISQENPGSDKAEILENIFDDLYNFYREEDNESLMRNISNAWEIARPAIDIVPEAAPTEEDDYVAQIVRDLYNRDIEEKNVIDKGGSKFVSIGGIFDVPVEQNENGKYKTTINSRSLINIIYRFNDIQKKEKDPQKATDAVMNVYRSAMQSVWNTDVLSLRVSLRKDKDFLSKPRNQERMNSYVFYAKMGEDLVGSYHKFILKKSIDPRVFDIITGLAQKNDLTGYKNLYEFMSSNGIFEDTLTEIQAIQPNISYENFKEVLEKHFSTEFCEYFNNNQKLASMYKEQSFAMHRQPKDSKIQNTQRGIYCAQCKQFRPGSIRDIQIASEGKQTEFWGMKNGKVVFVEEPSPDQNLSKTLPVPDEVFFGHDSIKCVRGQCQTQKGKIIENCQLCDPTRNLYQTERGEFLTSDLNKEQVQLLTSKNGELVSEDIIVKYGENSFPVKADTGYIDNILSPINKMINDPNLVPPERQAEIMQDLKSFIETTALFNSISFVSGGAVKGRGLESEKNKKLPELQKTSERLYSVFSDIIAKKHGFGPEESGLMAMNSLYWLTFPEYPNHSIMQKELRESYTAAFLKTAANEETKGNATRNLTFYLRFGGPEAKENLQSFARDMARQGQTVLDNNVASNSIYLALSTCERESEKIMQALREMILNANSQIPEGMEEGTKRILISDFITDNMTDEQSEQAILENVLGEQSFFIPKRENVLELNQSMTGKTEEQAQVILENHIAKRIKTESSSNAQDFESRPLPAQFKNTKQLAELVNIVMDQLKDTNTRDANPETPEDFYLPDTDDMAKIMSMPFEVQKALLKIKKDPKIIFNPEARKALAFLILSYYQRKSNNQPKNGFLNLTDQMTERKGYSLELNVMHSRLPRQKESKTAWGSTGKVPSMMSYILGAHFKKILPHFTEEMAKIPQGMPRASSANWYKKAQ